MKIIKLLQILNKLEIKIDRRIAYDKDCNLLNGYNFVIDCRGYQFIGPSIFFKGEMEDCLNKKNG